MTPGGLVRASLLAAGLAFAIGAELVRLRSGWPIEWVIADLLPGLGFLVVGQIAWVRRPASRNGALLTAIGFAWYVGTWAASQNPLVDTVATAFQGWYDALLAWLVLAYPTGRFGSRATRMVVGCFLAVIGTRSAFRLLTWHSVESYGDLTGPGVADRYISDTLFRETGDAAFRAAIAVVGIVVVLWIVRRMLVGTSAGRRLSGPMLLGGLAVAVGILVEVATFLLPTPTAQDRFAVWDLRQALTVMSASIVPLAFVFSLIRSDQARTGVADLVVELGSAPDASGLRDALARALHDPTLQLVYAMPTGSFVDAEGRPATLPDPGDGNRTVTRLEHQGEVVAALVHDPALSNEQQLVASVAAAASLSVQNERLAAEVRAQLAEVRASRARIVEAGDAERRRVERDLHDGAQQRLVTLALALRMARDQAAGDPALAATMGDLATELDTALAELRELARGIHPTVLTEAGLGAAVEGLVERLPIRVDVRLPVERCPPAIEAAGYFVIAEALTNVAKYADAGGATVSGVRDAGSLVIEITDDGRGGANPAAGSGLRGLADRVAAVGGSFDVVSPAGGGTTIRAVMPCD